MTLVLAVTSELRRVATQGWRQTIVKDNTDRYARAYNAFKGDFRLHNVKPSVGSLSTLSLAARRLASLIIQDSCRSVDPGLKECCHFSA
jgi:hypothetical protein